MDKNFKIWGMTYGLIGDLIMGLPLLTYFEKKYPGSYKYWVIEKKISQCAPLYFNHPLIDRIKIMDTWDDYGKVDRALMSDCKIVTTRRSGHKPADWYNYLTSIDEMVRMMGVDLEDYHKVLTEEEKYPKLYKWFEVGFPGWRYNSGYSKRYSNKHNEGVFDKNVAIWPSVLYGWGGGRGSSLQWWGKVVNGLIDAGCTVFHYGVDAAYEDNLILSKSERYKKYIHLSFFEQIQAALASKMVIGPDTGSMWVMGAYSHPAINLMTDYFKGHKENLLAHNPVNINTATLFAHGSCDNIRTEEVIKTVLEKVK